MEQEGGDVDPEKIVSMYRPHRKRRQIGAALLRLDKLSLALLAMLVTVGILFAAAFMQEKMGNFTINLDRLEMYRRGISIADNGDFKGATARLTAAWSKMPRIFRSKIFQMTWTIMKVHTMARTIWHIHILSEMQERSI